MRFDTLSKICRLLECQPGDILEHDISDSDLNSVED
ncbi:MAG: hypothetical protein B7Z26_07295 [Asticcacaulis sp. 32-58-5]|nr:MAG: hypothetical protein B7Z26_07295 [Asticcacaulis sp. 32-58-5]